MKGDRSARPLRGGTLKFTRLKLPTGLRTWSVRGLCFSVFFLGGWPPPAEFYFHFESHVFQACFTFPIILSRLTSFFIQVVCDILF